MKKRNNRRSRRALPISAEDIRMLDIDAPIPTYEMDKVLTLLNEPDRIRIFREEANIAAEIACKLTEEHLKAPAQIALAIFFRFAG
jgi:hypothetical protein